MIVVAFGATGYWIEGAIAAVGGGLSSAYLVRSSFGRIDTDQLNLGLVYLIFGLLLFSANSTTTKTKISYCILAGCAAYFLEAWYGKPELLWLATVAFFWLMFSKGQKLLPTILYVLLFLSFSSDLKGTYFDHALVPNVVTNNGFTFPNTVNTVTETNTISVSQILVSAVGSIEMGLVCLSGLGLWFLRQPRIAIGTLKPIGQKAVSNFLLVISTFVGLTVAWTNSATYYVPKPSFSKEILQGFQYLDKMEGKENSVVATWWDYGYASLLLNGIPTLHDGGSHNKPTTHFVAKALLSLDQRESVGILRFLATQGIQGVEDASNKEDLYSQFDAAYAEHGVDIYLVLTNQMTWWIEAISNLGNWDIEKSKYQVPYKNPNGPTLQYMNASCGYARLPESISCRTGIGSFNTAGSSLEAQPMLWATIHNGFITNVVKLNPISPFVLQTQLNNNYLSSQLLHRDLYGSTFNQLFHLGQIEDQQIKLVVDHYPYLRIFKISHSSE